MIGVVGDPVLKKLGILFPKNASLEKKETLFNQIAHAIGVESRYPGTRFPNAMIG
jgi:hypothetical protein